MAKYPYVKACPDIDAALILGNGEYFFGRAIGAKQKITGEVCFNTSITGYQEILTDPSYTGQIINFTAPHIGNVGCNPEDAESPTFANGLIVCDEVTQASNFRSETDFNTWLINKGISGISGIDTRHVTNLIRDKGVCSALIICRTFVRRGIELIVAGRLGPSRSWTRCAESPLKTISINGESVIADCSFTFCG